ncbi:MAG: sulfotransferase [Lacipirellulaceae bacterium]
MKPVRVFVVGCPRSGTTLVQSRLSAHGGLSTFPETQLMPQLVGMQRLRAGLAKCRSPRESFADTVIGLLSKFGYGRSTKAAYQRRLLEIGQHIDSPEFREWQFPATRAIGPRIDYAIRQFDAISRREGTLGWIEKSPTHLRYIDLIQKHVPDALFVHVIRDGRATVASIWEAVKKDYHAWRAAFPTIDSCVTTWNNDLNRTLQQEAHPHHLVLNYHEFCEQPDSYLETVWRWLGLPEAKVLEAPVNSTGQSGATQTVLPYEKWKASTEQSIKDYGLEKYMKLFSEEEQVTIAKQLTNNGDVSSLGKLE